MFAAKLGVGTLSALFVACGALHAQGAAVLAATPQFNSHYAFARSGSCRYSASAACRRRPRLQSAPAVSEPTLNGVLVVERGPGSVRLQGSAEALQLEVHDSTIAAVLAAMRRAFAVRYRSATPLNAAISGTYAGSLTGVIARVLDGYNYVIKHESSALDVAVFGNAWGPPAPAPSRGPNAAAATPLRRGYCGCPPIWPPPFATRLSRQNRCSCGS